MHLNLLRYCMLALSILGSATLLFSCNSKPERTVYDYETLLTEMSENRTITMMENGKRSYTFTTPLMEGYSMASNPYQEFRRGIKMTTYTDTLSLVDATITANYAIYYERQKLWEAKGNVVIVKNNRDEGDTTVTSLTEIYTQQLFWNATTKKIYSNVDTKVLQPDGWHFGVGFDADEDLKNIHFRKYSSEMEFDMSQPEPSEQEGDDSEEDKKSSNSTEKLKDRDREKQREKDKRDTKPGNGRMPSRGDVARDNSFSPTTITPSRPNDDKAAPKPVATPPSLGRRDNKPPQPGTLPDRQAGRAVQMENTMNTSKMEIEAKSSINEEVK